MPAGITTNVQLSQLARSMRIPYFRGVYMRNALPRKIRRNESGIVNLDDADESGTQWRTPRGAIAPRTLTVSVICDRRKKLRATSETI